jgi:hypothetical protein
MLNVDLFYSIKPRIASFFNEVKFWYSLNGFCERTKQPARPVASEVKRIPKFYEVDKNHIF